MDMDARLEKIEDQLVQYNALLELHIKRTDLLEDYVKDKDTDWTAVVDRIEASQKSNQKFTIKLLAGIGTFAAVIIPLIVQLLDSLK